MPNNNFNWMGNQIAQTPGNQAASQAANPPVRQTVNGVDQTQPGTQQLSNAQQAPGTNQQPNQQQAPFRQGPPPVFDIDYIPGYLMSIIGKQVRAEFVLGNSQYVDKSGVLVDVGVNYFVLNDRNARSVIMCDLYSVKFVTYVE